MNRKKITRISAVLITVFATSLLLLPGVYDRYIFSFFYPRVFEMGGVLFQVTYPTRIKTTSDKEHVVIENIQIVKSGLILDGIEKTIMVKIADADLQTGSAKEYCKTRIDVEGITFGIDGVLCFARTRYENGVYEFHYVDYPELSFFSKDDKLELEETGLTKRVQ